MNLSQADKYTIGQYTFINFTQLDESFVENVRLWRNHPSVRKYMYNSNEISKNEHLNFIHSLAGREDRSYWLVYIENCPLGVVSIVDIDYSKSSGEIGYYLLPSQQDSGNGLDFLFAIYHFLFNTINCKELYGRTEVHNINALALNYYLGAESSTKMVILKGVKYIEFTFKKDKFLEAYQEKSDKAKLMHFLRKIKPQIKKRYTNN